MSLKTFKNQTVQIFNLHTIPLSLSEMTLLNVLNIFADNEAEIAFVSNATLATKLRLSEGRISHLITQLSQKQLIQVEYIQQGKQITIGKQHYKIYRAIRLTLPHEQAEEGVAPKSKGDKHTTPVLNATSSQPQGVASSITGGLLSGATKSTNVKSTNNNLSHVKAKIHNEVVTMQQQFGNAQREKLHPTPQRINSKQNTQRAGLKKPVSDSKQFKALYQFALQQIAHRLDIGDRHCYVLRMIQRWHANGLDTVAQVQAAKQAVSPMTQSVHVETIPSWYEEWQHLKEHPTKVKNDESDAHIQADIHRLMHKLNQTPHKQADNPWQAD